MPSINEVIERVNRARPDAIDDETKAAWLLELDGQLFQEVILRHRLTSGRELHGPVGVCPVCGAAEGLRWDRVMDSNSCADCGWNDLPEYPKSFPEGGDKPLLVGAPYPKGRHPARHHHRRACPSGGPSLCSRSCDGGGPCHHHRSIDRGAAAHG